MRGILGIDVDGVTNAWHMRLEDVADLGYKAKMTPVWGGALVIYRPEWGEMLLDLASECDLELMWASAWQENANDHICPLLGLPQLPVLHCYPEMHGLNWKFGPVAPQVAGRPMAWLDDQFTELGVAQVTQRFLDSRPEPTLLVAPPGDLGIRDVDLQVIRDWKK